MGRSPAVLPPGQRRAMKIAVVVSTFPPYQGGMGNMARSYALGLAQRGHDVEVFCPAYQRIVEEPAAPFRVHRLKPRGTFRNSAFLPPLLGRLSRFDVINLHYPFYGGAESVLFLKKIRTSRLALVINFQMDSIGKGLIGLGMEAYAKTILPLALKAADRVIVTSFDYAAHSTAASVFQDRPEKFVAIPPGVDVEKFTPRTKSRELLSKFGFKYEDRIVLFVGGLDSAHAFKGVDFLIKTWARLKLPETKLLIVGRGNLRENYIRLAADSGISSTVFFDREVRGEDLPAVYNLADMAVLPSVDRSEAFGIVLLEAMASGVPILASNLPGVRSVVEEGRNGFIFRVKDRDDLSEKLALLIKNTELRARMGVDARTIAVSRYNQDVVWAEVELTMNSAFDTCLGPGEKSRP